MPEENLKQFKDEICRHFDVVAEDLKEDIKAVSEQVASNTEQITALQTNVKGIKDDIEIIKIDIEFIKNELKQKVSREEFVVLEKRVSMLEAKQK
jgi:peptidoglycan hydrolase CwlO-like protein